MKLEIKPCPLRGEVTLSSPDGIYLTYDDDLKKQVMVVGPCLFTPGQIEENFIGFEIDFVEILPFGGASENEKKCYMRRGFLSIVLRRIPNNYVLRASAA